MGRLITIDRYMNMLAERTLDNSRQLRKDIHQRRNGMEDLYGVCFSANGDANTPARFFISLSPDYVYLQRFAFKFVIKPYTSSVAGVSGGGSISIGSTELTLNGSGDDVISGTSTLADSAQSVTPNPHTHSASGGSASLDYGVTKINTTSTDWRIEVSGVDITAYLKEQQDIDPNDPLFSGMGVFPNNSLIEDVENFYDILDVASVMYAEDTEESLDNANELLKSEFKRVDIFSDHPFGVDAYVYLKYAHLNR